MLNQPIDLVLVQKEIKLSFIRAPGPGGQNVNKVATAVQLRFSVANSSALAAAVRARIMTVLVSKLTAAGDLVIKASRFRTQERNKQDALARLITLLQRAAVVPKKRRPTKPSLGAVQRRLTAKKVQSQHKVARRKYTTTNE